MYIYVCVCVYVYICIYIYIYTHIYIYIYTHTYIHIYIIAAVAYIIIVFKDSYICTHHHGMRTYTDVIMACIHMHTLQLQLWSVLPFMCVLALTYIHTSYLHTQGKIIVPAPDLRLLNLETAVTKTISNDDVPKKGINYHMHRHATCVCMRVSVH
jgi:hypothetical protein